MHRSAIKDRIVVPGFLFSGVSSGIKTSGVKDLAVIYSLRPATVSAVFTKNRIKAAPVQLGIERIPSRRGRAIVVNSGNANACTGPQGLMDAREMADITAGELNVPSSHVYVSSTGVIGKPLPMAAVRKGITKAVNSLSPYSILDSASAIMTTDAFPKAAFRKIRLGNKTVSLAGIAKGAGMICPDMATMLCFLVTDAAVTPAALSRALQHSVANSFNRTTVDNDMSTNDTVIAMANGHSGGTPVSVKSLYYRKLLTSLLEVTYELAGMIASDGEGATKMITVDVAGSRTGSEAEKVARSIASSLLVKTAVYGRDPNWGRIIAAAGSSGVNVKEEKMAIFINDCKVFSHGVGTGRERSARKELAKKEITITVHLGAGRASARMLTCDLTEEYIRINSEYTT
jgi:glutamate N-acetyltransferase/amino-acid N-acetyltransferase